MFVERIVNVGDTLSPLKKTTGQRLRRNLVSAVENVERALVNVHAGSFWRTLSGAAGGGGLGKGKSLHLVWVWMAWCFNGRNTEEKNKIYDLSPTTLFSGSHIHEKSRKASSPDKQGCRWRDVPGRPVSLGRSVSTGHREARSCQRLLQGWSLDQGLVCLPLAHIWQNAQRPAFCSLLWKPHGQLFFSTTVSFQNQRN